MRFLPFVVAALGLAACTPQAPDSGAGVGFGDYNSYIRNPPPVPAAPLDPMNVQTSAPAAPASRQTGVARPYPEFIRHYC